MAKGITVVEVDGKKLSMALMGHTASTGEPLLFPVANGIDPNERAVLLHKAGYRMHSDQLKGFEHFVLGWVPPVEEDDAPRVQLRMVEIPSDSRPDVLYKVAIDEEQDEALECSCPAGRKRTPCKHLFRARVKAAGSLTQARNYFMSTGKLRDDDHFHELFSKRVEEMGRNAAIAHVIHSAFGPNHRHAILPPADRNRLAKKRRK